MLCCCWQVIPAGCKPEDIDPETGLNYSQLVAVATAMRYKCSLIQGPPGTGKTTVSATLLQLLTQGAFKVPYKILACAHTNMAVDGLALRLAQLGVKVVRFCNDEKVSDARNRMASLLAVVGDDLDTLRCAWKWLQTCSVATLHVMWQAYYLTAQTRCRCTK